GGDLGALGDLLCAGERGGEEEDRGELERTTQALHEGPRRWGGDDQSTNGNGRTSNPCDPSVCRCKERRRERRVSTVAQQRRRLFPIRAQLAIDQRRHRALQLID